MLLFKVMNINFLLAEETVTILEKEKLRTAYEAHETVKEVQNRLEVEDVSWVPRKYEREGDHDLVMRTSKKQRDRARKNRGAYLNDSQRYVYIKYLKL